VDTRKQARVNDVIAVGSYTIFEERRKRFICTDDPFKEVLVVPGVEVECVTAIGEIEKGRIGIFVRRCGHYAEDNLEKRLVLSFPGDGSIPIAALTSDVRFKVLKVPS
jgi:hypothetical protein